MDSSLGKRVVPRHDAHSDSLPYRARTSGSTPVERRKGHSYRAGGHGVSFAQGPPFQKSSSRRRDASRSL